MNFSYILFTLFLFISCGVKKEPLPDKYDQDAFIKSFLAKEKEKEKKSTKDESSKKLEQ